MESTNLFLLSASHFLSPFVSLFNCLCLPEDSKKQRQKTGGIDKWVRSVSWSESTAKSGYTTKVSRSDCQYCLVDGRERREEMEVRWLREVGGGRFERKILWYFGMLEGWMWRSGGWGSNYWAIIGGWGIGSRPLNSLQINYVKRTSVSRA